MKDKRIIKIVYLILLVVVIGSVIYYCFLRKDEPGVNQTIPIYEPTIGDNTSFDYNIIKEVNTIENNNYMISPLSIAFALNMLNEGSKNNTKKEISNVLSNYNIPKFNNVKSRIGIANALFVKDKYEDDINKEYINNIISKYGAEVLFDKFINPDVINNWVKKNTYEMIPSLLDKIEDEFVLGLANAIAIDVEWKSKFDCNSTTKKEFTKYDGTKLDTVMMNSKNSFSYIENDNAIGIVKDYKIYDENGKEVYEHTDNGVELEFISILPKNDIKDYINNFSINELNNLLLNKKNSDSKTDYIVNIPRFTYEYTLNSFTNILNNLGIKDAFNPNNANLSGIKNKNSNLSLYVNEAIHKTIIEFNENGTKAAAVTAFIVNTASIPIDKENVIINFDKPFLYIIKEKNSDNIWFFGTVYEPSIWTEDTNVCENEK